MVVGGCEDGSVRLWRTEHHEGLPTNSGHEGAIWCCAFSPDSAFAVTGGADGHVRTWDARSGRCLAAANRHDGTVWACAVTPDAQGVVSGGEDHDVVLAESADESRGVRMPGHTGHVLACAVSPDGSFAVSGAADGSARVWDLVTGRQRLELACDPGAALRGVAVSPDATLIAAAGTDRRVHVWEARTGEETHRLALPAPLRWVRFHPSLPLLAFGGEGGHAHISQLAGVTYGPLVVTARGTPDRPEAACPSCGCPLPAQPILLGRELRCPGADCASLVRVNGFVLGGPAAGVARSIS